jgi:D-alanyl-D-alanine carboxypeptidase
VVRGENLTVLQALQAMLIPPGSNIAFPLARWDGGLQAAFAAKMNAAAGPGRPQHAIRRRQRR